MKNMRYLITGGLGFIGHVLAQRILQNGGEVHLLDDESNPAVSASTMTGKGCHFIHGDVRNLEDCQNAIRKMDVVIHLAAQTNVLNSVKNPFYDMEMNVQAVLNILESCRQEGVKNYIFASSNAVSGDVEPPMHEKLFPRPISPYGCTKMMGELYANAYHKTHNMKTIGLRFANVYGPGSVRKGSVVAKFMKSIIRDEPVIIYGDGKQTRDFIYIDDIVDALWRACQSDRGGSVYCIGSGMETSVNELVKQIEETVTPDPMRIEYVDPLKGELMRNYSDPSLARHELGAVSTMNLNEGLQKTWQWFQKINLDQAL